MASILIAEDSATQATQIRLLLERDGHSVLIATDGKQATAILAETLPDIIITDLNMPEMDGLELVEFVRTHHSEIPIVLLTANGTEDTAVQALRKGATSYLPKRELSRSLVSSVSEIMERIEARRSRSKVMDALITAESTYVVPNDHRFAGQVIAQLEEQLRTMNYSDATGMVRISVALREAVTNAIDHGNLELDSELREDDESAYTKLGQQRARQEPWMDRRVTVTSRVTPNQVCYTVSDQGPGFDPSSLPDPLDPENLLRTHGRGLMLIRNFMDEVIHNDAGNQITMIKHRVSLRECGVSESDSS
ncbi:MAG: response regulator [Fuerstiella sp.]|nr:response regulator [Fuerstiella sp.]